MKPNQPYHVGIVVANIEEAVQRFSDTLGLTFGPIQQAPAEMHGIAEGTVPLKVTYSTEGPVYIELIQGTNDDGYFSLKNGEGIHHLGVWGESHSRYKQRAAQASLPIEETVQSMPGEPQYWLSNPGALHGTRVEFTDDSVRAGMEAWIKGETPSG